MEEGADTKRLKISADGRWTVTLLPLENLRRFDISVDGKGDDVLVYTGGEGIATITHKGQANFVIQTYGDSTELLVNEIGWYSGEQLFGGKSPLVWVTADGTWSIKVAK